MTNSTKGLLPAGAPPAIEAVLDAYRPTGLPEQLWAEIFPDAKALVLNASPTTRIRTEHDIQAIAAVARHLAQRGRPLTLDEVLADSTLLSFDQSLKAAGRKDKTREKLHGVLRRLQAAHRDVPSRAQRRPDGERVESMPSPDLAAALGRLEEAAARSAATGSAAAAALLEVVEAERAARRKAELDPKTWAQARRFAGRHGMALTRSKLSSAVTHQVLQIAEPIAVLAAEHGLSRRDLDLGLTHSAVLPEVPMSPDREALRGAWPPTPDR